MKRVRIIVDQNAEDPRQFHNLGTMVTWHKKYKLGDEQPEIRPDRWLEELEEEEDAVYLPLYLYDHSGITISTRPFHCPWDSGQIGYIYCTLEEARKNFEHPDATWDTIVNNKKMRDLVIEILETEVKLYDLYITGQVFGFVVEEKKKTDSVCGLYGSNEIPDHLEEKNKEDWKEIDSVWGFYGSNVRSNGIADHLADSELIELAEEAMDNPEIR